MTSARIRDRRPCSARQTCRASSAFVLMCAAVNIDDRSAETRDAWRLAGVWCAVGRTRDHYWDGSVVSTLDEGEMFVLEVGVSGVVTGRALATSKLSTSLLHSTHRGSGEDDLFEMSPQAPDPARSLASRLWRIIWGP